MLLNRNHLLLADEAMPTTQRLGVIGRVGIISRHIAAHDGSGVFGNIKARLETVLQAHACDRFSADAIPGAIFLADQCVDARDMVLIRHALILLDSLNAVTDRRRRPSRKAIIKLSCKTLQTFIVMM